MDEWKQSGPEWRVDQAFVVPLMKSGIREGEATATQPSLFVKETPDMEMQEKQNIDKKTGRSRIRTNVSFAQSAVISIFIDLFQNASF